MGKLVFISFLFLASLVPAYAQVLQVDQQRDEQILFLKQLEYLIDSTIGPNGTTLYPLCESFNRFRKKKRSNRDGLDLLSHSFEIGERIEKQPPSLIGELKF